MQTPRASDSKARQPRGTTSRRTLLVGGLAISPLVLAGLWAAREARGSSGSSAVAAIVSNQGVPACVVTPQQTEGPYFVDEQLIRYDVRSDPMDGTVKDGAPLQLTFRVMQVNGQDAASCAPLAGAMVDIWQCDALGVYSDVQDPGFNTVGTKFLRGSQVTDENGVAAFLTIYPGWYQGRTVHTHFKVRTSPNDQSGYEFTSQLYYDDALTDIVHAQPPYSAKGRRTLRNSGDGIYGNGGEQLLLNIVEADGGYAATIDVGVDLSAPSNAGGGAPGGPRGGR
jgi:protocatechuate 3,4-dioxygenase beta subunit